MYYYKTGCFEYYHVFYVYGRVTIISISLQCVCIKVSKQIASSRRRRFEKRAISEIPEGEEHQQEAKPVAEEQVGGDGHEHEQGNQEKPQKDHPQQPGPQPQVPGLQVTVTRSNKRQQNKSARNVKEAGKRFNSSRRSASKHSFRSIRRKEKERARKIDSILNQIGSKYSKEKKAIESNNRRSPVKSASKMLREQLGLHSKRGGSSKKSRSRSKSKGNGGVTM